MAARRKGARSAPAEFAWIARHFAPLAGTPGAYGLKDDAAVYAPAKGRDIVVTADTLVSGVHFLPPDPWDLVAQKLIRVNVSDLAAKGAIPHAYVLCTAYPKGTPQSQIAALARGLGRDQARYGVTLLGGDSVATPGPAAFTCTMFGHAGPGRIVRRGGARPGDDLWITGTIGCSGAGLRVLTGKSRKGTQAERRRLARRYRLPEPPADFGAALPGLATAAMDVSDGLIQDAGHLAQTSGVALRIALDDVPLSEDFVAVLGDGQRARLFAAAAGDDYQILFTARPAHAAAVVRLAALHGVQVTAIGTARKGAGVSVLGRDGKPVTLARRGYTHF
jgi:thiamine-monophosphate kinase